MKFKTYCELIERLKDVKKSKCTLAQYNREHNCDMYQVIERLRSATLTKKETTAFENLVKSIKASSKKKENVDNDERSDINFILDDEGKIQKYAFNIFTKDKLNIKGELTRDEMERIFGMYSRYGANLSQAVVYQEFPRWSYVEFQRILRVFKITKNGQLPEHLRRELTQEEQENYYRNLRANNARRNFDAQRFKYLEADYKKVLFENETLKSKLNDFSNIKLPELNNIKPAKLDTEIIPSNTNLMLHLSDWHIGATTVSGSLYPNKWGVEQCTDRLIEVLHRIKSLNTHFDTIIINNLGDCLDGMDSQTARRDHILPQNMDDKEMINNFIGLFVWFVSSLVESGVANNIKIYSVPNGNHCGAAEYVAIKTALMAISYKYPNVETMQFEQSLGYYKFNDMNFLIMHGKDERFAKRGMPLNVTEKVKCQIHDFLVTKNFNFNDKIYVIKGDLHTANLNSDFSMDYRTVLSLFGNSDYANENFIRNPFGVSYTIIKDKELLRGEFDFYE